MRANLSTRAALGFLVAALVTAAAPVARGENVATPAGTPGVTYFRAENVAKSFEEGAVLFDRGTNYMIHTSRRTAAGKAEIHTKDTDIIYVLEGSASFVTGGKAIDAVVTAPDELRGSAIEGGETRLLEKGDVIVVPAGTPHWFREVRGPVLYYTIKVR